jgi:anti-sigma factor RsiW
MNPSCDQQPLSAYLDGELSADDRAAVERHVTLCPDCAERLLDLALASRVLRELPFDDITEPELARLHEAVTADAADDAIWRLGATLGLVAASFLIVGLAWLNTTPLTSGRPGAVATSPPPAAPAWERVAMTLEAGPLPAEGDQAELADARFADWMIEGLGSGVER